ncbi:MAG: putative transporter ATP-binding protein [Acidimicrobiales bacterium]|jgi:ABC-2 type transport system ATP-binding protein|nr:putative transporter ATP-binding protein [Acidimicrobiales bacterium]
MTGPAISTSGLTRSFKDRIAVDELTFDVAAGEVVALLGPNGAGKTTTVRMLNGVLAPDRGSSSVLGLDPVTQGDDVRRLTGVLTESAGLDDRLTAMENLVAVAQIRGMTNSEGRRRGLALLDRFGMAEYADRRCQGFSTGQRKRVALARALLHDPEVLFLDEPTSGLDPEATRDVVDLIASLARERGRTVILCTHFLAEANRIADRMAVLQHGRLRAFGRPDDLAAELWQGLAVDLDFGVTADERAIAAILTVQGVLSAEHAADGALVRVGTREDVPALVAAVVELGLPVFGAAPHPATVEDVYFAIQGLA